MSYDSDDAEGRQVYRSRLVDDREKECGALERRDAKNVGPIDAFCWQRANRISRRGESDSLVLREKKASAKNREKGTYRERDERRLERAWRRAGGGGGRMDKRKSEGRNGRTLEGWNVPGFEEALAEMDAEAVAVAVAVEAEAEVQAQAQAEAEAEAEAEV